MNQSFYLQLFGEVFPEQRYPATPGLLTLSVRIFDLTQVQSKRFSQNKKNCLPGMASACNCRIMVSGISMETSARII